MAIGAKQMHHQQTEAAHTIDARAPGRLRRILLLSALPATCLYAAPLFAHETFAQKGRAGEAATPSLQADGGDIVVTAQRRAQTASSVGLAITAISGEALAEKGINSAEDLWRAVPGLVVKDAGFGVPNYTLRGVGFENYFVNSSSTVGLYANEIAIPYPAMSRGAFFDLERVEVLKGPQGDLYGRNTTAGQINFIDRKPTHELTAGGQFEFGRFNEVNAQAYVGGPLAQRVQMRLSGVVNFSNGWQRSLSRPDEKPLGAKDQVALRGQLNFDLGPDSTLLLRGHWNRDKGDGLALTPVNGRLLGLAAAQRNVTRGAPVLFSTGNNRAADWSPAFRPSRDNEAKGVSGTLNLGLGGVNLTAISAYDKFRRDEFNDLDGSPANDSNSHNISHIEAFSQEVRLANAAPDAPVQWIVGGYYSHDRIDEDYRFFMPDSSFGYGMGIRALNTRYRQKTSSLAGFAHVEAELAEGLRLVGGARYTREKRSFAGCTYDLDGSLTSFVNRILIPVVIRANGLPVPANMVPGGCSVYDDRVGSPTYGTFADAEERARTRKWMWKAGVEFDAAPDVLLYADVSTGFKSGGFNGANANLKSQQSNYRPEELTAYEAGVKANLRNAGLYLDASAFYYDYKDKQTNGTAVTFVGNITGITNIPKSRIFGIDATARWTPFSGAALEASGTYLDSKIRRWQAVSPNSAYPRTITFDASGQVLPNTPKWTLAISPSYAFAVGGDRQIKLAADYYYRSRTRGIGAVFQDIPGYGLANGEISYGPEDGRWTVAVWGENVFNKYYYNFAGLPGNSNYVRAVGTPATYGVRLGVSL